MMAFSWDVVFARWLASRECLDRIEYADVRRPAEGEPFDYVGPIAVVTR